MIDDRQYAKCACESCGGHIEFPVEHGGSSIECPHCHFPTLLPAAARPAQRAKPQNWLMALMMLFLVTGIGYATWRIHFKPGGSVSVAPSPRQAAMDSNQIKSIGVATSNPPPRPVENQWKGLQSSPVTLQKVGEGALVYAVGRLTNVSDQQKFGVKVGIDLFNDHGEKIGSATDYTASIDAGKEWVFRALVVHRGAVKAELKEVTEN